MTLHLYGSSLTGFGLTDSDVDISVAGSGLPSKLLLDAFNTLYQHGGQEAVDFKINTIIHCNEKIFMWGP